MSFTIYEASIVQAKYLLTSLRGILAKAEAHPDAATFPDRRLAPDMLPFSFQISSVCALTQAQALKLLGKQIAKEQYDDRPLPTYAAMHSRIDEVWAMLEGIDRDAAVESATKTARIDFGKEVGEKDLSAIAFCAGVGIPNMYFHTAMAYAILRNAGVDLGKFDYLGPFWGAYIDQ
ncbi:hypothetical protein NLG97_g8472 [Lecanicillium saksenae]|uniref:Uncharacterized protein n=1 Tax=Lecanicillium saksenae TaxID=468837 RepID=A0ACC1QK64_9HYPO|nr:hypothetical protein NLG97_g8472 [Lecanicillium saksenae]